MTLKTTIGTMTNGKVKHNGTTYPIKEVYIKRNGAKCLVFKSGPDFSGLPGSSTPIATHKKYSYVEYYGKVKENELKIKRSGIRPNLSDYTGEFLKVRIKDKMLFIPPRTVSFVDKNTIEDAGYANGGGEMIFINGKKYKQRLLRYFEPGSPYHCIAQDVDKYSGEESEYRQTLVSLTNGDLWNYSASETLVQLSSAGIFHFAENVTRGYSEKSLVSNYSQIESFSEVYKDKTRDSNENALGFRAILEYVPG